MKPDRRKLDGWLILDKPLGITSAQAVARVKHLLRPQKIGHGGTLDPLASGVLPLALGEATKTMAYVQNSHKTYRFRVTWGEERTTDDAEGDVTAKSPERPLRDAIEALLPRFTGEIMQTPPRFSAIKTQGQRAYDLARAGEAVTLAARPIQIYSIEIADHSGEWTDFNMTCGKGGYVRAMARDLGRALGCYGYVSQLRRAIVGQFDESRAITLEKLGDLCENPGALLLPVETVLDDIPALALTGPQAERLRQGQAIRVLHVEDGLYRALWQDRLVALVTLQEGWAKSQRGFNL